MRQLTKIEIDRIKVLTENSVDVVLIEPTETGLKKSILDATATVRTYLLSNEIHDYSHQAQGQENKVIVDAKLINETQIIPSSASLYRPSTKQGDPRIWFKKLADYSEANEIIGIIAFKGSLCLINLTRLDIRKLVYGERNNPLKELITEISNITLATSEELLFKLKKIASHGPIPSLLAADTSIGRTLETLLGITINSSKKPDYKGIELKAFRESKTNRKNLFAQVPDWHLSKFKSSAEILNKFGYKRNSDFKLYCTVSALTRNSQGLKLKVDNKNNLLIENSDLEKVGDFVVWALGNLHKRLLEKHNETFWITATSKIIDNKEHFIYKQVEHTKKPIVTQFDILLDQGIITLDHLIKRNSKNKVVEKGPLFKIKPNSLSLLFPPSQKYSLIP